MLQRIRSLPRPVRRARVPVDRIRGDHAVGFLLARERLPLERRVVGVAAALEERDQVQHLLRGQRAE